MEVEFKNKKLQKCYEIHSKGVREFGDVVASKYILRINTIMAASNIDELNRMPVIRCHPLHGNREGQYAINLTGQMRLIFTLDGDKLQIAKIEEVSKHYDG
ncbi:proteic killer suppression protein [Marinomonas polaris DSM 16579]|uniref:Proteic killer suppression protein n=1 Tax=Marinomonas polaris DSM 16579 TaxID=1122206 RepID=A0A1M5I481_9GAMM|nr:type II toxin-antitoxin system RelE/ParE family toxin [Marinomonas polaris]SHG23134.1 proteic killer suppression protein [Marinomonas polaris DSM 16579]